MRRGVALVHFWQLLLLLLLLQPRLSRLYSSAAPAPPPPAGTATRHIPHPCLQALLLPSSRPHQGSNLTLTPHPEFYLEFPEPDRGPDPVASSGLSSKWDLALGLELVRKPNLGLDCQGALCPHLASQLKSSSGPSSIPGTHAEAALLHILSASSPPLSQRPSGALYLSWGLQLTGSRLTFRLYQPRGCDLCQVWKVTCNPYLEGAGMSCIPFNTGTRGVPLGSLAHLLLPGQGWDQRACQIFGQAMGGALKLVNSTLGIRVRGSTVSLNLQQAQTGSYGPGIYYSRAAPGRGSARQKSHLLFYQQPGLSWLFALDFLGSRCAHLSVHLYLSPKGAAFFGPGPHQELEVHFFTSGPLGPQRLIYLVWFIPLQHPLLHLQWTFHLQLPGASLRHNQTYTYQDRLPSASRFRPRSVLPFPPDVYAGFVEKADCSTNNLEPAILEASLDMHGSKVLKATVACVQSPCFIHEVRIKEGHHIQLTGDYPYILSTDTQVNCSIPYNVAREWNFYRIPNAKTPPNFSNPLREWWIRKMKHSVFFQIPEGVLKQGLYMVYFSVTVTTAEKKMKASDYTYLTIVEKPLVALIGGGHFRTVAFNERWTLDGSASSDLNSSHPFKGLSYKWYCTTNRSHFESAMVPPISAEDTCLPQLPDLRWIQESGPVLTILPGTLRGNQVYYFRLMVQKDKRKSFNDQKIMVIAGPPPAMSFSCIENCESNLIVTDRFSLSGKCTDCGSTPVFYLWSLLSTSRHEIPFDWVHQTTTGRTNPYLSIKASAFKGFPDQLCFISLRVSNWGGGFSVSNHSFYLNSPPQIGQCNIRPDKGIALATKFVIWCSDFRDSNLPLNFKIIASNFWDMDDISSVDQNTLGAVIYFGAQSVTPPSFLPIGMQAKNYLVMIYAQVYDSLGAFSQVTLYATVKSPLVKYSPNTVVGHLFSLTQNSSGTMLKTLFQQGDFVQAGYLAFLVASVLKDVKPLADLHTRRSEIQASLINFCNRLPTTTLVEINQVTVTILELTRDSSGLTAGVQKVATNRLMEINLALQSYRQRGKIFHSEQIEIVSTGISTSLSNIFKMRTYDEATVNETLYVTELLADTVSSIKVPGEVETVISTPNFKMHVSKDEKQNVTEAFLAKKDCQNCFYPTLRKNNATNLVEEGPISTVFYEFKNDPFPWLNREESPSVDVIGFRMRETKENGDVSEVEPEVVEAFILRKNLKEAAFNLTVGPDKDFLQMTTGVFTFMVNGDYKEVFVQIITEVRVLFRVLIYKGSHVRHTLPIASFLAPPDMPPVANESTLFVPSCKVKVPYLICLSQSLLQASARGSTSAEWNISVVLQSTSIVMQTNDKIVRISIFTARCLNMDGVQQEWGEKNCVVGDRSSWWRVHCVCHLKPEPTRVTQPKKPWSHVARLKYLTAQMVVIPNSIDLRLNIIQTLPQNPVCLFTVISIVFTYLVLAFWAMYKDETDRFLREHVIILPDNDPYDRVCYLVTFYTGSRLGSGTRADVFLQLLGTEASSEVHFMSHPDFRTFYRGSTDTFLLSTRSNLGSIRAIRVWHNNEGSRPSWYLSRVKVENVFNRHVWLFLCRSWLSVEALEQTFTAADKAQPLHRKDFFLIQAAELLGTNHLWLSVFTSVVTGPFNRLHRLSCCLTLLLSTLLCNIMFFNKDEEGEVIADELRLLRALMRGIESALICEPLLLTISTLFTYSQKEVAAVPAAHVAPRPHPLMKADFRSWKERLETWYYEETAGLQSKKQAPGSNLLLPEAAANAITATEGKPPNSGLPPTAAVEPGQHAASPKPSDRVRKAADGEEQTFRETGTRALNSSSSDGREQGSRKGQKPAGDRHKRVMIFEGQPHFVLHWWCIYVAWLLVIGSAGVSSFFIIMYGLTYGYQKSMQWLLASMSSLFQSIFVVQVAKILLLAAIQSSRTKYCKNIPWTTRYNYIEIRLQGMNLDADETRELHYKIVRLRGTRMYQPLVEDEIRIFQRRSRIKRRAIVFLRNIVNHLVFLGLLLYIVTLARHSHSYHHNQAVRRHFSTDLSEVRELNDTYAWLTGVLLPLVHNPQQPTFLSNSWTRILGLPRMRQVRAKSTRKPCFLSGTAANRLLKKGVVHCQRQYSRFMEDRKDYGRFWTSPTDSSSPVAFTYEPKLGKWAYYSYGLTHTYGMGGYPFYFFPEQQQYNSTTRLQELQASRWLDERTWALILELTTFHSDASLFCTISVVFEVSLLGVINPSLAVHSFSLPLFRGHSKLELYLYGAAVVFLVVYLAEEVVAIGKEKGNYIRNGFNLVSFGLKSTFLFFILLLYIQFRMAKDILDFYLKNPATFTPFHAISQVDQVLRIALGFLVFLAILKTLMYSRFFYDVRLAQRALLAALPGIFHMALLVGVYIFVYVVFGYLVFGQHEWNYNSIMHSTQTIFSYCVSAFRDTEFLYNHVLGGLFLSSFMLVMICVLINLFQAVILSAYEEMKQLVYEEPAAEVEAATYLFHKVRNVFRFLTCRAPAQEEPAYFTDILYGHPENKSYHYLGLKTRNINGRRMSYVVV